MHRLFAVMCLPLRTVLTGGTVSDLSVVYGVTALLSLLLLAGCCLVNKKRNPWFLLLFTSLLVVNTGYFLLSVSQDLSQALHANRLSYLGSVFLPLSMWMCILRTTRISYPKWLPPCLLALGAVMFLITGSPGILDIYYKEVTFLRVEGVSTLQKVYGPLHPLYLVYLLGYFAAMVTAIIHATLTDKIRSTAYATVLAIAVFVNIGVWLVEQIIDNSFEFLSVSYIISELFLLGLHLFMTEQEKEKAQLTPPPPVPAAPRETAEPISAEALAQFTAGLAQLTPKERELYDCYTGGMTTTQIMEQLNIKENTLKFHNKNLYGKLGVSSRKQLVKIASLCNK